MSSGTKLDKKARFVRRSFLNRFFLCLLSTFLYIAVNPVNGQTSKFSMPSEPVAIEHTRNRCTSLLPHLTSSPNQENAGSCIYMAVTGIGEMAYSICNKGKFVDLSERYSMNTGQKLLSQLNYWPTDMISILNINKGGCLNNNYRYTKGWYYKDNTDGTGPNGSPESAKPMAPGALFGTYYNWTIAPEFDNLPKIVLPHFKRNIVYKSKTDVFATGLHNRNIVDKVKHWLYTRNRPLLAIYNHFGYWHCVIIAGYDDNRSSSDWFSNKFIEYMKKRANFYDQYGNPAKAKKYRKWSKNVQKNMQAEGGTSTGKGVFFVRDSLYPDNEAPLYDYLTGQTGEENHLTLKYVEHDYTWLMHLVNHIVAIDF